MTNTDSPAEIDAATLAEWMAAGGVMLVDVREPEEFVEEHIDGAILIPLSSFDPRGVAASADGKRLVLHCLTGTRSAKAAAAFTRAGLRAPTTLTGGIFGWKSAGLTTVSGTE